MRRKTVASDSSAPSASTQVETGEHPNHPGLFVRNALIRPRGLSVLVAAKLIGVSRSALSNFLNGHVATTPEMAARLQAAFGFPASKLLELQAAFDAKSASTANVSAGVTPYAVPFLGIKARDIELWATRNVAARSRFAVFLRTLVHSTGRGITRVDFPGNDDAERPGWDGQLDATESTPWIPAGRSGWEFGTNEVPRVKADGDYDKSTRALSEADRVAMTFIFVTPRAWPRKSEWSAAKQAKGEWSDVRVYDASDLEQWMEQSIAAQVWFAHEVGLPTQGVRTLSQCWRDWADVASPSLPGSLFATAIEGAKNAVLSRLSGEPTEPIVVMADSTDEALAFVAQFFEIVDDPRVTELRERVLVFDEPGIAKRLAQGTPRFVAVVHSSAVERDLAALTNTVQSIVVYPRNATNVEAHVVLEPLSYEHFKAPLEVAGYSRDNIARLDNESGRSLTVLRRRLAKSASVRLPPWASDAETASSLVPFLFVGAWNTTHAADQTVLALLAGDKPYEVLERQCQQLTQLNDPPMWSAGIYRGVASKIDLLFAVALGVTRIDLERFLKVAQIVLGEDDPKLDLPDEEQWAATIHGKSREFSGTLRRSIAETLVLLSVHGNHFFLDRLGFDAEIAARKLVRNLLTPLKARLLEANNSDLTAYAEAAPDEFLSILEEDLHKQAPETYQILRPTSTSMFGGCPRTGLLWALEGLAWSPTTMPRAALILAQLSQIEINDNWTNRPINSLEAIFRAWMPQTAANHDVRLRVMEQLARRFPKAAWKVCIEQLSSGPRHGTSSHKPKWRNDGHGYGTPFSTWGPVLKFALDMAKMALRWEGGYTAEMIADLVRCLPTFLVQDQRRAWEIIEAWAKTASDVNKAVVREHIRRQLFSRRASSNASDEGYDVLIASAKKARAALEPTNLLQKHEWLFRNSWVEESVDELSDNGYDYKKREERIARVRIDALREVHDAHGPAGVVELSELGDAHYAIGYLYAGHILKKDAIADAIRVALGDEEPVNGHKRRLLLMGLINGCGDPLDSQVLLDRLAVEVSGRDYIRLLLAAPFRRDTWRRVDTLGKEAIHTYWNAVVPESFLEIDDDAIEAVERLISAKRPRAAFQSARFNLKKFDPEVLFRLMTAVARGGDEPEGHFRLEKYYIDEAFARIDQGTELSIDQKAGLEYLFIDALAEPYASQRSQGIPNLEKYVELHPEVYVQAIAYVYRRSDGESDPPELTVADEHASRFAEQGYKLLSSITKVPGRDDAGHLTVERLRAWIKAVRDACTELSRLDVADVNLGELLAHAPVGEDGVWPCEPVRDVLEEVHSSAMMDGIRTGQFNARGAHWRGEGGAQERELAEKYRAWAEALRYSHPYVSSSALLGLAKNYEFDARREDTEAIVRRRLR